MDLNIVVHDHTNSQGKMRNGIISVVDRNLHIANILSVESNRVPTVSNDVYNYDIFSFRLIIPKYDVSVDRIRMGGYIFRTDGHLDTYSDLPLRMASAYKKSNKWKISRGSNLSIQMTKREALFIWREFLNGDSNNIILKRSISIISKEGSISVLESEFSRKTNIFLYPIIYTGNDGITPWGYIRKSNNKYVVYWKISESTVKQSGADKVVERAKLVLGLMQ